MYILSIYVWVYIWLQVPSEALGGVVSNILELELQVLSCLI